MIMKRLMYLVFCIVLPLSLIGCAKDKAEAKSKMDILFSTLREKVGRRIERKAVNHGKSLIILFMISTDIVLRCLVPTGQIAVDHWICFLRQFLSIPKNMDVRLIEHYLMKRCNIQIVFVEFMY